MTASFAPTATLWARLPLWMRCWATAAACCIAVDCATTLLGAHVLGARAEGNALVNVLRHVAGTYLAEALFDTARVVMLYAALHTFAKTTRREVRLAIGALIIGFVVIAIPVLVGNVAVLAAS